MAKEDEKKQFSILNKPVMPNTPTPITDAGGHIYDRPPPGMPQGNGLVNTLNEFGAKRNELFQNAGRFMGDVYQGLKMPFMAADVATTMALNPDQLGNKIAQYGQDMRGGPSGGAMAAGMPVVDPNTTLTRPPNIEGDNDANYSLPGEFETPDNPTSPGESLPPDVLQLSNSFGDTQIYANPTPPDGYGDVIYSDSAKGARGFNGGAIARPSQPGQGPFGRSLETQAEIDRRVKVYNDAAEGYRQARTGAQQQTEQDRLQKRANARVSLDQPLGGFLNAASDRNYARKEVTRTRQLEADKEKQQQGFQANIAKLMAQQANADRTAAIQWAQLQKPEWERVGVPYGDPDPITGRINTRDVLMNPQTGQQMDPMNMGGQQMSRTAPAEAVAELKEQLAAAKDDKAKEAIRAQFTKFFDLPEGM